MFQYESFGFLADRPASRWSNHGTSSRTSGLPVDGTRTAGSRKRSLRRCERLPLPSGFQDIEFIKKGSAHDMIFCVNCYRIDRPPTRFAKTITITDNRD
jgi:hypothetical protein